MTTIPIYLMVAVVITAFLFLFYAALATVDSGAWAWLMWQGGKVLVVFSLVMIPTICFVKVSKEGERVNETH